MVTEDAGDGADGLGHQVVAVRTSPDIGVEEHRLVGENSLHAVFIDRQEQGVLGVGPRVERAGRNTRQVAQRRDGEAVIAPLLQQAQAGVENPPPLRPGTSLSR